MSLKDDVVVRSRAPHPVRRLVGRGLLATLAAMAATTLAAGVAMALGVDFEIPEGGEAIPLAGFAVITGLFSSLGVAIAAALLRWGKRPARRFVQAAVTLTVLSFVPSLLSGATSATASSLVVLHLVAAAVMIPVLTHSLASSVGSGSHGS